MNKTYLYIGGAAVIALIVWFGMQTSPNSETNTDNTETTETTSSSNSNLRELLAAGSPQQCTFTDSSSTGTTYIANKQIRTDYTTTTGNKIETGHMILTNEKLYIWTDGESQGIVMEAPDTDATAENEADAQLDLDKDANYDCKSWRMDSSKLQPPTNVTFSDMASFMGGANGNFDFSKLGR